MSELFTFQVQDETCSLRVDDPALMDWAADLHSVSCVSRADCSSNTPADLVWSLARAGGTPIFLNAAYWDEAPSEEWLFLQTQHLLDQLFIHKLGHCLQFHAASVVSPSDQAFLICGESGSGKTSLALSLMLGGWKWLSDEAAVFRQEDPLRVLSFPRNFNIKEFSFTYFPETKGLEHGREIYSSRRQMWIRFIDPEILSPFSYRAEATVAGLIFPAFDPNLQASIFTPITSLAAAELFLRSVLNLPPWGVTAMSRLVQSVPSYEFRYRHPREILKWLPAGSLVSSK